MEFANKLTVPTTTYSKKKEIFIVEVRVRNSFSYRGNTILFRAEIIPEGPVRKYVEIEEPYTIRANFTGKLLESFSSRILFLHVLNVGISLINLRRQFSFASYPVLYD